MVTINKYYHIISHSGTGGCLNVYGNDTVDNGRNVCLYEKGTGLSHSKHWRLIIDTSNVSQIYKVLVTRLNYKYRINKVNAGSNPNNCTMYYNASENCSSLILEPYDTNNGLYRIKLSAFNQYLTTDSKNNLSNVYWGSNEYASGAIWKFEEIESAVTNTENYLTYPCKTMNISQNYNGSTSHYNSSHGSPKDYPIDEACEDTGRSSMYCPCDKMIIKRIYGVGNSRTNTIWLRSTEKVKTPSGEDYIVMMVIHPLDDDLSNLHEGQEFSKGDFMFKEGDDGHATGYHFHISIGFGDIVGTGWTQNSLGSWVLTTTNGTIKPENGFYIDSGFTTIVNSNGLNFTNIF